MSLLAPLYFAGAMAIGLPILFHLIRRRPKGEVEFSSLMFLKQSPPRLTRRSRLDNWFLLLLRALALMLLAAAFARPFLRSVAKIESEDSGRSVMLLVDTSASMQRVGLWQQALDISNDVISEIESGDLLAVVTFDRTPETLLEFEQSSKMDIEARKGAAKDGLQQSRPSWHRTNIGRALTYAAELAVSYEPEETDSDGDDAAAGRTAGPVEIVLVSDMQEGSEVESLQSFEWPESVTLDVRRVTPRDKTNAWASILTSDSDVNDKDDRVRVRVTNAPDSDQGVFRIAWEGNDGLSSEFPIQVPPGESQVVRMPEPTPAIKALALLGDDHSFDNKHYLVSPQPRPVSLMHVGAASDEPRESLLYYLERIPLSNAYREVSVEAIDPAELATAPDSRQVPLVVVAEPIPAASESVLREYVSSGGRLLVVLHDAESAVAMAGNCNSIAETKMQVGEAEVDDYAMLGRIRFDHPLFASMADPQFNDFSKIRFWSHRRITDFGKPQTEDNPSDVGWSTVASFDDGDPALLEIKIGSGTAWVMSAGWQPGASQLALSTKFIPLVFSFFDSDSDRTGAAGLRVGDALVFDPSETATLTKPSGEQTAYRSADDADVLDAPGVYKYTDNEVAQPFAINLDSSESQTEPMSEDALERFGVALGDMQSMERAEDLDRQMRDQELENRQKIWQWLLVTALGLLAVETWLGKRVESRTAA